MVVAEKILSRLNATVLACAIVCTSTFAAPAFANSSANADIAAPLRATEGAAVSQTSGDQEFRQLFGAWRSMDSGSGFAAAGTGGFGTSLQSVSIPSRAPLDVLRLTSDFGMRWHPILGGRREHDGVDLGAAVGTPVYATADGIVSRADWFGGYGLCIDLEHGAQLETRCGHMSRLAVASGQMVHKGDVIGYVGTTGRTTGPHLHYEVRVGGIAVNPIPYLQGAISSVPAAYQPAPVVFTPATATGATTVAAQPATVMPTPALKSLDQAADAGDE